MVGREELKILIIDDDAVDRGILRHCLLDADDWAPIVAEAASGREGIDRAASIHPDCILLDYRLPDLDGIEVVRALTARAVGSAVVMLTAIGNERIAVEAMKAGALDYTSKDAATPEALQHIVRNAVEKFRLQRQIQTQREAIEQRNRELEEAIHRESLARNEAESSKVEYRLLVETIPQIVWRSTPNGEIIFANERWTKYFGRRPETGRTWLDKVHPGDAGDVRNRWQSALEPCIDFEVEARLFRSDGQDRWHLISATPTAPPGPDQTWLFTATDVTEQKEAQKGLLQKQKLDSIGLLAGGVAHDFNNLLVGIMGSASFALDTVGENHPAHSLLGNIVEASERAAHLTRQLLAYAGKGQFTVESIELSKIVLRTTDLVAAFVPKTVQVKLELAHLPAFQADPGQIEQVAMNLIINAAEAIGPDRHGLIGVRTSIQEVTDRDTLLDVAGVRIPPGRYAVLEVRDTGCGIPDDIRTRIFDPFFTTKFTGRGLGLAAVQGIVRSNKGAIQISSVPEKGTTFRVLWPVGVSEIGTQPSLEPASRKGFGTVLVIDDERIVRRVAEVALGRAGYRVLLAESGDESLVVLRSHPEVTSVLLDMNMPGMSGPETLARLNEIRPDLPVIVCSGFAEAEVRRQFEGFQLAGVIPKPFTSQKLADRVTAILDAFSGAASLAQS
jgi:PAS domain S-box-containing protein